MAEPNNEESSRASLRFPWLARFPTPNLELIASPVVCRLASTAIRHGDLSCDAPANWHLRRRQLNDLPRVPVPEVLEVKDARFTRPVDRRAPPAHANYCIRPMFRLRVRSALFDEPPGVPGCFVVSGGGFEVRRSAHIKRLKKRSFLVLAAPRPASSSQNPTASACLARSQGIPRCRAGDRVLRNIRS